MRVRKLLTGLYQRHCSMEAETAEESFSRFGKSFVPRSLLSLIFGIYTENALDRDHFMSGEEPFGFDLLFLLRCLTAQDALKFGLIDGILEKSPKRDSDNPSV